MMPRIPHLDCPHGYDELDADRTYVVHDDGLGYKSGYTVLASGRVVDRWRSESRAR